MPRTKRNYSEFLHVIVRGINKQIIFGDDDDKQFFLNMVRHFKEEEFVKIIVFCLMDNHVHMLVHDPEKRISSFMKRLCVTYSVYFNKKYERCGYLFQDRFLSEAIEDEKYFRTVFAYILMNPEKAGICVYSSYRWSSVAEVGKNKTVTDFEECCKLLGNNPFGEIKDESEAYSSCIDIDKPKHNDAWALSVIKDEIGISNPEGLRLLPKETIRNALLLMKKKGIPERQIERITGITRFFARKYL